MTPQEKLADVEKLLAMVRKGVEYARLVLAYREQKLADLIARRDQLKADNGN